MANEGIISTSLLQNEFKAAGVYTIYRDRTVEPRITSNSPVRLIYGFSKQGAFNVPVFIEKGDFETAERIFGKIDLQLERKGSFFHRSIKDALQEGSVLALNLLKLNSTLDESGAFTPDTDIAPYQSFSVDISAANGVATNKLYASYYDKQRFWKPSVSYLLGTRSILDQGNIFNLTNLAKHPISFIVKKSDVRGYSMTLKEWYGSEEIPKYLNPNDEVKDTFIDVIAIYGDFGPTKYATLSSDPIYGKYFTTDGIKINELSNFLSRPEIRLIDIYTGSLIPNFKDKAGNSLFIETIINQNTRTTNILCAVDKAEFDKFEAGTNTKFLDLVGHRMLTVPTDMCNFLSYKKKISQDFQYPLAINQNKNVKLSSTGVTSVYSPGKITLTIASSNPHYNYYKKMELDDLISGKRTAAGITAGITIANPVLKISKRTLNTNNLVLELTSDLKSNETISSGSFVNFESFIAVVETRAEATAETMNVGDVGDIIKVKVNNGFQTIQLSQYIVQSGDTTSDISGALAFQINLGSSGYEGASVNAIFSVLPPMGNFEIPNHFYELIVEVISPNGNTEVEINSQFVNGAGNPTNAIGWISNLVDFNVDGTNTFYIADSKSQIYSDFEDNLLTNGDKVTDDGTLFQYIKLSKIKGSDNRDQLKIEFFDDKDLTTAIGAGDALLVGDFVDSNGIAVVGKVNIISLMEAINQRIKIDSSVSPNMIIMDIDKESDIKLGHYLIGENVEGDPILTKISSIKRIKNLSGVADKIEITCLDKIKLFANGANQEVERYYPIASFFDTFNLHTLSGFSLKQSHMPDNTNSRMNELLSVMLDTNIARGLKDPDMIDFRYIVDTFNHGLETQSKRKLSRLVKERSKCLGILNTPSMKEFSESQDPRFTNTPTPADPVPSLNTKFIFDGGNLEENPTFRYSLPEEEDGASYVGFFAPNFIVRDSGGDDISYPPAALVSNNFIRKYSGGANPFQATAGPRRGIITGDGLLGLEYPFDMEDRGYLEEKGINPIIMKNDGTMMIYGNETGYQRFNSVLNQLNVRDMLVTIEINNTKLLENYVFEYNNDTTRTEVDTILREYLGGLKDAYKAIESFDIVFDRNNNPNFVLREQAAVVDIVIEPANTTKKYVQRITLTRGNKPNVGGFVLT